ncbi:MAG: RpiB/LacA/LacB family sugar-phosphate isomerase [Planctomycetota bacterium]|nr:RpiB/LacA/LacB family sugar-phosphate isomerase [Planctomycetota bacterium]
MPSRDDITPKLRAIARRAARRALGAEEARGAAPGHVSVSPRLDAGATGAAPNGPAPTAPSRPREDRDLVAEGLVRASARGSELVVPPGARITPLAKELAFQRGVRFVSGRSAEPEGGAPGRPRARRIAVASDHGGFALKEELLPLLREMGERPLDLGPATGDVSVDYPDYAALVARDVSEGRADLGIVVDGAGIGSAMVANKLPGVLAANCWDERTARNAREHNHANVLTLGSGHLDLAAARAVVAAFLMTPAGAGRHARRADKTRAVEAENLRARTLARTFDEER